MFTCSDRFVRGSAYERVSDFSDLCDLFMDGRTVRSTTPNRPQTVVADWWTFRPPPFAHQPVSLSQYSLRTHTHTHARTHIHADCHCSAVVSSSVCTCALQTEAVRVTPMNPVDCPWGTTETGQFKQLAMSLYCIAWIYGLFLSPFLR